MTRKQHAALDAGEAPSVTEEKVLLTLDEYIVQSAKHYGLVASYKREAFDNPKMVEPKTASEWDVAFAAQSKRVYK